MLPTPSQQQTILIIDDEVATLKLAVEYLREYSFEILIARDGESGLERARRRQPALILLDVTMPGIDGFEACRRLKANPITAPIPILFMTSLGAPSEKVRGFAAGAADYITKPIEASELLARVQVHLRLYQLQDNLERRVQERTAALEAEIAQRIKAQEENTRLLEILRQQSEQLRQLTEALLDIQLEQSFKMRGSHDQLAAQLGMLEAHISQARQLLADSAPGKTAIERAQLALSHAQNLIATASQQSRVVGEDLQTVLVAEQELRSNPLLKLTDREYEIFQLLLQGKSNAEISETLVLARTTVSTYQRRIMEKLGVTDLPSLIRVAIQQNLI